MTDQKDDLVAEARVALAIKQAADVCDAIRRAADEIVNAGADFQDYHSGKAWASEECHDTILALPHDPEALEALLRQARNEALEKAAAYAGLRAADCKRAYDMAREDETFVKFGCEGRAKEALNIGNAIRAMKGEGHD